MVRWKGREGKFVGSIPVLTILRNKIGLMDSEGKVGEVVSSTLPTNKDIHKS